MQTTSLKTDPTAQIGFIIGIGAWSITFVMLILGYVFYRLHSGPWLIDYINAAVVYKAVMNTGLLAVSSWMLHRFWRVRKQEMLWLGLLAGMIFLLAQWKLWVLLLRGGLTWTGSIAGSFIYLLTGFHAVHVLVGLGILLPFGLKIGADSVTQTVLGRFFFALKFWDLLMFFWLGLFILIFIFK